MNRVDLYNYFPEQKWLYLNPWPVIRLGASLKYPALPQELASIIVYAVCTTFLWEQHAGFLNKRRRILFATKARIRFLLQCLEIPRDARTLTKIKADKSIQELMEDLGISKNAIINNPSIVGVLVMIQTALNAEKRVRNM